MRWSLLFASLFVVGCSVPAAEDDGPTTAKRSRQSTCEINQVTAGSPRVWFSPFDPVEDEVLCALDGAKREVVIAHYNIRSERVIDKLIELRARGVVVRAAIDAANSANEWNVGDDRLERGGVSLVRYKPAGTAIMHLKAAVIDSSLAMTGSFNWNETASNGNDENMIAVRDPALVSRYRNQILELLGDRPRSVETPKATTFAEVHFSPERALDAPVVKAIDGATRTVDVAMFTFTMRPIADALIRAVGRGVRVRLITEEKQEELSDVDDRVAAAGATVIRAANRLGEHSAMHQKYAVIDGKRVLTGASNWTSSGTRSNEEDLVILDHTGLAAAYARNFADLLHVYAGIDEGVPRAVAPVLFHGVEHDTQPGDTLFVVGSDPALGAWNPRVGLPMNGEMWPDWTARARFVAGATIEWKLVLVRASGEVVWEPGSNRVLRVPANGAATVATR